MRGRKWVRVVAAVLVVAAFAGLLGAFLMERERHQWAVADSERRVSSLRHSLNSQERMLTATGAAEVSLRETELERLRLWTEQSTAETQAHLSEKIVLLGLTMGEVTQRQGIELAQLVPMDNMLGYDHFFDGQYSYRLDWMDRELPLGERVCLGILGNIQDMTGTNADGLLAELGAIFNTDFVWMESESEGFCAYSGRALAGGRKIHITIYADADRTLTEEHTLAITLVEMVQPVEEMSTQEIVFEKAELLGLSMAVVARIQGIRLENLGEVRQNYYFDPKNRCYYAVNGEYDVPLDEKICSSYQQDFGTMFGERGETFLAEVKEFARGPLLRHRTLQLYEVLVPKGDSFTAYCHIYIEEPDENGFVPPEAWVTIGR